MMGFPCGQIFTAAGGGQEPLVRLRRSRRAVNEINDRHGERIAVIDPTARFRAARFGSRLAEIITGSIIDFERQRAVPRFNGLHYGQRHAACIGLLVFASAEKTAENVHAHHVTVPGDGEGIIGRRRAPAVAVGGEDETVIGRRVEVIPDELGLVAALARYRRNPEAEGGGFAFGRGQGDVLNLLREAVQPGENFFFLICGKARAVFDGQQRVRAGRRVHARFNLREEGGIFGACAGKRQAVLAGIGAVGALPEGLLPFGDEGLRGYFQPHGERYGGADGVGQPQLRHDIAEEAQRDVQHAAHAHAGAHAQFGEDIDGQALPIAEDELRAGQIALRLEREGERRAQREGEIERREHRDHAADEELPAVAALEGRLHAARAGQAEVARVFLDASLQPGEDGHRGGDVAECRATIDVGKDEKRKEI